MSQVVLKQLPVIRLAAETKQKNKRRALLKTIGDNNFTRAIAECCWNIVNQRVQLSSPTRNRLSKHKSILRTLSNTSIPLKRKKTLIQSGGFAALLPLLIGPIIAGISRLIKRKR